MRRLDVFFLLSSAVSFFVADLALGALAGLGAGSTGTPSFEDLVGCALESVPDFFRASGVGALVPDFAPTLVLRRRCWSERPPTEPASVAVPPSPLGLSALPAAPLATGVGDEGDELASDVDEPTPGIAVVRFRLGTRRVA